jgi:hypothetical protein
MSNINIGNSQFPVTQRKAGISDQLSDTDWKLIKIRLLCNATNPLKWGYSEVLKCRVCKIYFKQLPMSSVTIVLLVTSWPITVAARYKAWTVFARSNAGIVNANPTQGMEVVCVYSMFVLSCVWIEALRRADHSSKESYRLYKKDYETEGETRASYGLAIVL